MRERRLFTKRDVAYTRGSPLEKGNRMINKLTQRQRTLAHVTQGSWSTQMAAQSLGLSCRQIQRLKQTPKSDDRVSVPWNRKSQAVIDLVVSLKEDYPHRSNQRIAELVSDRLGE